MRLQRHQEGQLNSTRNESRQQRMGVMGAIDVCNFRLRLGWVVLEYQGQREEGYSLLYAAQVQVQGESVT